MTEINSSTIYSAMQTGIPYKSYRKTILGKVEVKYLDPFEEKIGVILLQGHPNHNDETCFIDMWSEKEDAFFKKINANHIKNGVIIPFNRASIPVAESNPYNVLTDEELFDLLNNPFFKLQQARNKMTSQAPVYRLLTIAESEEKSEKIINHIKARLSELQEHELNVR